MKYAQVDTPIGKLTVVAADTGIRRILWDGETPPEGAFEGGSDVLDAAVTQIREYFAGARTTFDLPLDLGGPPFQQKVWLELGSIPFGTTISYGEQARRIGRPQAGRIGVHRHDFLTHRVGVVREQDRVADRLAHFGFAVDAGQNREARLDVVGYRKNRAIELVEAAGDLARQLDM